MFKVRSYSFFFIKKCRCSWRCPPESKPTIFEVGCVRGLFRLSRIKRNTFFFIKRGGGSYRKANLQCTSRGPTIISDKSRDSRKGVKSPSIRADAFGHIFWVGLVVRLFNAFLTRAATYSENRYLSIFPRNFTQLCHFLCRIWGGSKSGGDFWFWAKRGDFMDKIWLYKDHPFSINLQLGKSILFEGIAIFSIIYWIYEKNIGDHE